MTCNNPSGCECVEYSKRFCKWFGATKKEKNAEARPFGKSRLKPVSDKRKEQNKEYSTLRKVFLEGKMCAVYPHLKATQVHHKFHREGERLNDVKNWLAVSHEGHEFIHANTKIAREQGWLL